MDDGKLVSTSTNGVSVSLSSLLVGSGADVGVQVADLKAELEQRLMEDPDDYASLVLLGELHVRTGLNRAARVVLYRASLLKPPSWEMYQRTALLLRRAEANMSQEVERVAGAPPPWWMRRLIGALVRQIVVASSRYRAVVGERVR